MLAYPEKLAGKRRPLKVDPELPDAGAMSRACCRCEKAEICTPGHRRVRAVLFHQGKSIKESAMIRSKSGKLLAGVAVATVVVGFGFAYAQQGPRGKTSYMP